jgi:hypothetical protein
MKPPLLTIGAILLAIGRSLTLQVGEWFATVDACVADPFCRAAASADTVADLLGLQVIGVALAGWAAVDSADRYEFTRVDLSTGDFVGQNGCDNGVHIIQGAFATGTGDGGAGAPGTPAFGVTVWGWGNNVTWVPDDPTNPLYTRWVSYGYPAGANFAPLNTVVLPAN